MQQQTTEGQNNDRPAWIFFDIDGVLGNFDEHARQQGKVAADGSIKYKELDEHWWATMPPYAGAKGFYEDAHKLGTVRFLTGPTLDEGSYSGKALWVQSFTGKGKISLKELMIVHSESKQLVAAPNRILIDDRIRNIHQWEAAGGIGIHHTGNFAETMKKLKEAVAKIDAAAKPAVPATRPQPVRHLSFKPR